MILLRQLLLKDAPLMLEWMHDPETQKCFRKDMLQMTIKDAEHFCEASNTLKELKSGESIHCAIVSEVDEYLGTVSLKNIDLEAQNAEYAISLREKARGKGIAKEATMLILKKAFSELGLHRVYLNVLSNNYRAIRLYEKCGFAYEGEFRDHLYLNGEYVSWKWYAMLRDDYNEELFM